PERGGNTLRNDELWEEEDLRNKINALLSITLGEGNFYTVVQVAMNEDPITHGIAQKNRDNLRTTGITIVILVDKEGVEKKNAQNDLSKVKEEIERQVEALVSIYNVKANLTVNFTNFDKKQETAKNLPSRGEAAKSWILPWANILALAGILMAIFGITV